MFLLSEYFNILFSKLTHVMGLIMFCVCMCVCVLYK